MRLNPFCDVAITHLPCSSSNQQPPTQLENNTQDHLLVPYHLDALVFPMCFPATSHSKGYLWIACYLRNWTPQQKNPTFSLSKKIIVSEKRPSTASCWVSTEEPSHKQNPTYYKENKNKIETVDSLEHFSTKTWSEASNTPVRAPHLKGAENLEVEQSEIAFVPAHNFHIHLQELTTISSRTSAMCFRN